MSLGSLEYNAAISSVQYVFSHIVVINVNILQGTTKISYSIFKGYIHIVNATFWAFQSFSYMEPYMDPIHLYKGVFYGTICVFFSCTFLADERISKQFQHFLHWFYYATKWIVKHWYDLLQTITCLESVLRLMRITNCAFTFSLYCPNYDWTGNTYGCPWTSCILCVVSK